MMGERWKRWAAVGLVVIGLFSSFGSLIGAFSLETGGYEALGGPWWVLGPASLIPGGIITFFRPSHPIGWAFVWLGFLGSASGGLAVLALSTSSLPLSDRWLFTTSQSVNTAQIVLLPVALYLFPNGDVLSPRWRWAPWLAGTAGVIGGVAALLVGGWGGDPAQAHELSPLYEGNGDLGLILSNVFFSLLGLLIITAGISIILRYRRSVGEERKQLQWLAYAGGLLVAAMAIQVAVAGEINAEHTVLATVILAAGFSAIPVAAAVAVLRYRLYDIDLIISRSLLVAGLAGFITLVYVAVVVGVGALVGAREEPSLVLQVVATALVAVLFQPVRRRVQRWADRLVYGKRATPYEVLSAFSRQAAQTPDESSLGDIAELLADGTGAQPAVVWLKIGDELVPTAVAPELDDVAPVHMDGPSLPPLPAELVVPVLHEGELFGALSVSKPRGEQVTLQDHELAERLGAGVGVVLRNVGLTADLRARLEELRDSRRRLVSAQDTARQKLERDLHDGAQQQLVALKVKLGLARSLAQKNSAERTAQLIEGLIADADEAVESLRDLARGIYPPLLEAEGLAIALEAQAGKAPLPVTVHSVGVGRYDQERETAVYFCVLEALTNAVRYSQARSVHIRITEDAGQLIFGVEDDGAGFDPADRLRGTGLAGMADRLDTVSGRIEIDSGPGRGTTVRGVIPIRRAAEVTA